MLYYKSVLIRLLFSCFCSMWMFASALSADDPGTRIVDSLIQDEKLLCLLSDGTTLVWSLPEGKPDSAFAKALSSHHLVQIAADKTALWSIGDHKLFSWVKKTPAWKAVMSLPSEGAEKLAIVDRLPVLIYSHRVSTPTTGRSYSIPKLKDQVFLYFHLLASLAKDKVLWIGTGQGEWGGNLWKLNVRSGEWSTYYDPLHYVTGIAGAKGSTLYVSWSMSHMMADTLIRTHQANAEPLETFPEVRGKYYQRIVYSEFDDKLYGVEQNSLVTIDNGQPTELANLGKLGYDRENDAVGVAPSIDSMFAIAPRTLVIVHKNALPFIYADGVLRQLTR